MKDFSYYLDQIGEFGLVEAVTKSLVWVSGLPTARPNELVLFETGQVGQILFLHPDQLEVLLLSESPVKSGTRAVRLGEKLAVPVGQELLGQVINSLGQRLYPKGTFRLPRTTRVINRESPGIEQRTRVRHPLEAGVALVDMLVPLGCGQRELVIGDRKTGKTAFLLQTVLNQTKKGMTCIWTVIGKERSEVKQIDDFLTRQGVMDKVVIIAASAQETTGLIYLAPYTALTLAEYFRDQGLNTLVVLDDMTVHAKFYRELALVSKRFPGRDSYPVDIFFAHASILEKGGNFKVDKKEVSITILPVAETAQGDLSGYVQTNLMSMTDGHIYFDNSLFSQGRRPAINPFLSVTRVGRQAQTPLTRQISRELMAFLTRYQKLESYVHFGAELTEAVKADLAKGERFIRFFDQRATDLVPLNIAVFLLGCLWLDFWPGKKPAVWKKVMDKMIKDYQQNKEFRKQVDEMIENSKDFKTLLKKIKTQKLKLKTIT